MINKNRSILLGTGYSLLTHIAVLGAFLLFYKVLRNDFASWISTVVLLCASVVAYCYLQYKSSKQMMCLVSAGITHVIMIVIECGLWSLIDQADKWHIWDPIGTIFFKGLSYSVIIMSLLVGLFAVFIIDGIRILIKYLRAVKTKVR